MASVNYSHKGRRVKMPAGATVTEGEMLKLSSNTVVPITKGAALFGVACNSASSGGDVIVARIGVFRYTAHTGVNFAPGDVAYAYTSTTLYAGASADKSVGTVVDTDPVSAGEVQLQITPSDFEITTAS